MLPKNAIASAVDALHALSKTAFSMMVALGFACAPGLATAQQMDFKRLLTDGDQADYDVGSIVTLAQDGKGFIWIGAEYGLARYDGKSTTHYPLIDTPSGGTFINDLLVDQGGQLWAATERGVHQYDEQQDAFIWLKPFPDAKELNRVAAIAVDQTGQLVLARPNGFSLFQPRTQLFKHFELPGGLEVPVVAAMVDQDNRIWLGTQGAGVALFNQKSNRFSFFQHDYRNPGTLADDQVTTIAQDHIGRIWIGTKTAGISRLDPKGRSFKSLRHEPDNPSSLRHNFIRDIYIDSQNRVWVATDHGGVSLFQEDTGDFVHFTHNSFDPTTLASNQARKVLEDRNGDLWVATFPVGLNYFNRAAAQFKNFTHKPNRKDSLSHPSVLCFLKDSSGNIWVGTENGLNQFHPETGAFTRFLPDPASPHGLQAGAVVTLEEDDERHLWVGTWSGGLHRFDKQTGQFRHYAGEHQASHTGSPFIWALLKDSQDRLWVGTEGAGISLYRPETEDFLNFRHHPEKNSINHNDVWSMLQDHEGYLWIGTTGGLNRFNPETQEFYNFPREANNPYTVDSDRVFALFQDSANRIWVGTQEAGFYVFDFETKRFRHFTTAHGLPSAYVTGFIEDDLGFIWASTSNGAVKIAPRDMSMTLFNKSHGLTGNNLYRSANMKVASGEIYLGGTDGFSIFNPEEVTQYPADAEVFFTNVEVPGSSNTTELPPEILHRDGQQVLELNYRDTVLNIGFSSLDFRSGENKRYAYRLVGFDGHWREVKDVNSVTYTNLSPGTYTFQVKAGTLAGWSPKLSSLRIDVSPPPWQAWWAYTLYIALLCVAVWLIIHAKMKQLQLHGEREVNNQLRNLNAMKDAFLANTSHELRTPLNGIIGIAESLRERISMQDRFTSNHLNLIISSGKRLSSLINDILDYSRLANNKLVLDTKPVDIYKLTENVFTLLEPLTKTNNIQLVNNIQHLAPFVIGDENRLQQILINLVGNGIKYTPRGSVCVNFKIENKIAYITVADTGLGIIPEKQATIFDAFSQGDTGNARVYDGSGLGLAITRQLVELHHGKIWVESSPGTGSRFIFTVPAAEEKDAKPRPIPSHRKELPETTEAAEGAKPAVADLPETRRDTSKQSVLIVDDDSVNRMVLKGMLSLHNYEVLEAANGAEAIEMVTSRPLDLIIMDVMMPAMTGYEACKIIRNTFPLENLPILFLTAKSGDDEIATCFDIGGNDYLTKPINKNDLLARVAYHLRIRHAVTNGAASLAAHS